MRLTDRQWRRETKRLPKWRELKEAYAEYHTNITRKYNEPKK